MKIFNCGTKTIIRKIVMMNLLIFSIFLIVVDLSFAVSDTFPPSTAPSTVADFLASPNNTYYCSPTGNNSTGDGSRSNPWVDLIGAARRVQPGDLIYFRGGTYPTYSYVNFSRSQNILSVNGNAQSPIVITNYPGEIVVYNSVATTWCMTLDGDYQKIIGTKVGNNYGIQITGGISVRGDNCQVSGIDFAQGTTNGGDANPAMLSVPLNDGLNNLIISHNYFHDAKYDNTSRMSCIRLFNNTNSIVEYNLFKDNLEVTIGGVVYFKDTTNNATVRYNTFVNNRYSVVYVGQHPPHNGLDVHHNLFYNDQFPFYFMVETGANFRFHDNIALSIRGSFFAYQNNGSNTYTDRGEYYNNVIAGTGFSKGWSTNASNPNNLPNVFDYNLWYSAADRNGASFWTLPSGYHNNAVTSDGAVAYDATTMTCTVDDNYVARNSGRSNGAIGGLTWDGVVYVPDPVPPVDDSLKNPTGLKVVDVTQ